MAIELMSKTVNVEVEIFGETVTLICNRPSRQDQVRYNSQRIIRKGNKIKDNVEKTRAEFGERAIVGFVKGPLVVDGKPISSDSSDKDYYSGWKGMLLEAFPSLPAVVGAVVYESVQGPNTGPGLIEFEGPELEDLGDYVLDGDGDQDPLAQQSA